MLLKIYRNKRVVFACIGLVLLYTVFFKPETANDRVEDEIRMKKIVEDEQQASTLGEVLVEFKERPTPELSTREQESPAAVLTTPVVVATSRRKKRVSVGSYERPAACITCPGENGTAVEISADEEDEVNRLMKSEFFNLKASDKVSLWRAIPDIRFAECKALVYPSDLPSASVVIIFTNERWSPLLRTVYSVIHESPRRLLKEIILIDDQSDLEELGKRLRDYCDENFGGIVKIFRTPKRLGLINAKNFGAGKATGDVVVFLDSHCEAGKGWLEPILARIKEKPTAIVCPTIHSIDARTLQFQGGNGALMFGTFTWSLFFNWDRIPERIQSLRKSQADNYASATMAGGLLAANREYFFKLGGYDEGMEIWGGENLEISFKVWMCGGSLEFIPCSNVGHIFRDGHPYNMTGERGKDDVHGWNSMRLAEVWMDDYKRLYYMHRPDLKGNTFGDVSKRQEIRKKLNCKSFNWYLKNVIPEKFVIDEDVYGFGQVRVVNTNTCLDTMGIDESKGEGSIGIFSCQATSAYQVFSMSLHNELRREDICLFASLEAKVGDNVGIHLCQKLTQEKWEHTKNGFLRHIGTGLCLDAKDIPIGGLPKLNNCDRYMGQQLWQFQKYLT